MKALTAQQLAFILGIKKEDARAKMCVAWAKFGATNSAQWEDVSKTNKERLKVRDDYPTAMSIEILSKGLNMPDLQTAVDDIQNNYLKRPASKKYILFDYPTSEIKKIQALTVQYKTLRLPPALRGMISNSVKEEIKSYWKQKYPDYAL